MFLLQEVASAQALLTYLYVALTVLKLFQWALLTSNKIRKKKEDFYTPSLSIFFNIIGHVVLGAGENNHVGKVPRKELRAVTDPWVEAYNRKYPAIAKQADKTKSDGAAMIPQKT